MTEGVIAFFCFLGAGSLLVVILTPQTHSSVSQKRFKAMASALGIQEAGEPASKKISDQIWYQTIAKKWAPFHNHISALTHHTNKQTEQNENKLTKLFTGVGQFYGLVAISFIAGLMMLSNFTFDLQILGAIGGALLIGGLRYRYLTRQQQLDFENQLPGVIDQLSRTVASGLSVPQGLSSCAEYADQPVKFELQRLSKKMALGVDLASALEEAQQRIPVAEFKFLSIILILNQQTGGQLSDALANLADSLRKRKALRLKLATLTSEPRAAATIVSAFPFLTLFGLWWFNPQQWTFLTNDPSGQQILMYAFASIVFGLLLIHRLAKGNHDG